MKRKIIYVIAFLIIIFSIVFIVISIEVSKKNEQKQKEEQTTTVIQKEIVNHEWNYPIKNYYKINDELDLSDLSIKLEYNDGSSEIILYNPTLFSISNYDFSSSGAKKIEVSYLNYSSSFDVYVENELNEVRTDVYAIYDGSSKTVPITVTDTTSIVTYSINGITYQEKLPTIALAGIYTIYYQVVSIDNVTTIKGQYILYIDKCVVDVPTLTEDEFVYDGQYKTITLENPNYKLYELHYSKEKEIGNYTVTVKLIDSKNYRFKDTTEDFVKLDYSIKTE